MRKLPDWRHRLDMTFYAARKKPFAWGEHDCATFSASCVSAMTGSPVVNLMQARFPWKNKRQALRLLARRPLLDMTSDILGVPCAPNECGVGDILLLSNEGHVLLGVHDGHGAVCVGDEGLLKLELESALCGWRIP